jgi:alkanesulfonate monooxygenase SsuD/methylene tetrahydromethanopterin reductase-like flavin-dependent oxidoreductase (luciferase family)
MANRIHLLPPTSESLLADSSRPYFLWWTDVTVGELKRRLVVGTPEERAYWLGALLREANSRDVWLFTTPSEVRALWPHLLRHLGRTRARWAWLLDLEDRPWPPVEATSRAG